MARFEKREVKPGSWKIRDTEGNDGNGKWVTDGNGRQVRHEDEERIDAKVRYLEEAVNDDDGS